MAPPIISIEHVSKKYVIGHQHGWDDGLRHRLERAARSPFRLLGGALKRKRGNGADPMAAAAGALSSGGLSAKSSKEDVWALRDVSFDVAQGEMVGIIGRNGAGKSTLLKILSRITEPTEGRITMRGRVSSLLEVGTGFHQELTGRENIYLNGAILGMSKVEITRRFDAIVAFSEIEKFLDTPVKRYSSGMYVRLAFAVAAHMEPEILIVDEVLAVGDAAFQRKCLGKMNDVSAEGRTILFVSHDMQSVTRLCRRGVLLSAGQVECDGEMNAVVAAYLGESVSEEGFADLSGRADRTGRGDARFDSIELLSDGARASTFSLGSPLVLRLGVSVNRAFGEGQIAVTILTSDGIPIHCLQNANENLPWRAEMGRYSFEIEIPQVQLVPGGYFLDLWMGDSQTSRIDYVKRALGFNVIQTPSSGLELQLKRADGLVFAHSNWIARRKD